MNEKAAVSVVSTHRRELVKSWLIAREKNPTDLMAILNCRTTPPSIAVRPRVEVVKQYAALPSIVQKPAEEAGPLAMGASTLWILILQIGESACLRWTEPYLDAEAMILNLPR